MRKLITLVLLAVFGLSFASPLLASAAAGEAHLPACCRKGGTHHCVGVGAEVQRRGSERTFRKPVEACPYRQGFLIAAHQDPRGLVSAHIAFAGAVAVPSVYLQAETTWRVARERSRHKRGPPAVLSL